AGRGRPGTAPPRRGPDVDVRGARHGGDRTRLRQRRDRGDVGRRRRRVIVDTSVWVEFFRGTGSAAHLALEDRIRNEQRIVVPDVVLAEVLVGTTDETVAAKLERTLAQFEIAPTAPV